MILKRHIQSGPIIITVSVKHNLVVGPVVEKLTEQHGILS